MKRRTFVAHSGMISASLVATQTALTVGLLPSRAHAAWPSSAFEADDLSQARQLLFDDAVIEDSVQISITAPDIAENGRVVPVKVRVDLPNPTSVALFARENPTPLLAKANFTPDVEPEVALRVKLGATTELLVLAEADGGLYRATRNVKVTSGGCGG